MKNIILFICIIFSLAACSKSKQNTSADQPAFENDVSNALENKKQNGERETPPELRDELEKMPITEIIDLYIRENLVFDTDVGDYKLSCLFISPNQIQWSVSHTGFEYYPYLYIVDEENIRIELFYYAFPNYGIIGEYISAGKDYITITKENLIARFTGSIIIIDNFIKIESFKINKFMHEDLNFKMEFDTAVYSDVTSRGEKIADIRKDAQVEIIDLFFSDSNYNYISAVKIKAEDRSGWVSAGSVNFFQRETKGDVNGVWLYNAVRNVVNEYGKSAVRGKIVDAAKPLRSSPSPVSEPVFILWGSEPETSRQEAEAYIEEVSAYLDYIDGIESVWYKISLLGDNKDHVTGWVFGSNLEINPVIDFSFNSGYR